MKETSLTLPGQSLGGTESNTIGTGTHVYNSQICSSLAGILTHTATSKTSTLQILRGNGPLLPEVSTVVLGKITRTNPRQVTTSILALGSNGEHVLKESFPGLIRQQDIRATEIDKVKVNECFRVGDIVRAVVISLGDERSYYLSTAKNELGVVMAVSEWGNQMYPISWREFQDPIMGMKELRKVAKPV